MLIYNEDTGFALVFGKSDQLQITQYYDRGLSETRFILCIIREGVEYQLYNHKCENKVKSVLSDIVDYYKIVDSVILSEKGVTTLD